MALSQQAAELGERSDRPDVVARAALVVQGIGNPALNTEIVDLARRALALLPNPGATALRARVEAQLACGLYELGEVAEADRWSTQRPGRRRGERRPQRRAGRDLGPGHARLASGLGLRPPRARAACRGARPTAGPASGGAVRPRLARGLRRSAGRAVAGGRRAGRDATTGRADRPAPRPLALAPAYRDVRGAARRVGRLPGATVEADRVAADWHDDSIRGTQLGLMVMIAALRGDAGDLPADWEEFVHSQPLTSGRLPAPAQRRPCWSAGRRTRP